MTGHTSHHTSPSTTIVTTSNSTALSIRLGSDSPGRTPPSLLKYGFSSPGPGRGESKQPARALSGSVHARGTFSSSRPDDGVSCWYPMDQDATENVVTARSEIG